MLRRPTWEVDADLKQVSAPPRAGILLVLAAATLWGTTGTAQAFAPSGALPPVVGALRLLLGGFSLLVIAALSGALRRLGTLPRMGTLLAAIFIAAYQLLFFAGVARTGVAVGTILGIGSAPIFGGILGALIRKETLARSWFLATVLALAGSVLMIGVKGSVVVDPLGVCLAVGAGLAYSLFTLVSKGLLETHPPLAVSGVVFSLGAVMLLPVLVGANLAWLLQPAGALVILHLGLVATALAYILFTTGLRRVQVSTATTLTLAEPLTAGLVGVILLGEKLTPVTAAGILLLLGGLVLISLANARPGGQKR